MYSRRDLLRRASALGVGFGFPFFGEWNVPALAQTGLDHPIEFEVAPARPGSEGKVAAAPLLAGAREIALARALHERNGYGLVIAHRKTVEASRFYVHMPFEGDPPSYATSAVTGRAVAVYEEFLRRVMEASRASLDLYISFRVHDSRDQRAIDVTTSGLNQDEAQIAKSILMSAHEQKVGDRREVAVFPVDETRLDFSLHLRNRGALLYPNRGYWIVLPNLQPVEIPNYADAFSDWAGKVMSALGPNPNVEVLRMENFRMDGRFSWVPGALDALVTAPHGGADTKTDDVAERIAAKLGISALIVNGYLWSRKETVNVDRPTGGSSAYRDERQSSEAREVYRAYRNSILRRVGAKIPPYIEIHCNNNERVGRKIEVAAVNLKGSEADRLKKAYDLAFERIRGEHPQLEKVPIRIEPNDVVYMNAFGNKAVGFLKEVKGQRQRGITIELPASLMYMHDRREARQNRIAFAEMCSDTIREFIAMSRQG